MVKATLSCVKADTSSLPHVKVVSAKKLMQRCGNSDRTMNESVEVRTWHQKALQILDALRLQKIGDGVGFVGIRRNSSGINAVSIYADEVLRKIFVFALRCNPVSIIQLSTVRQTVKVGVERETKNNYVAEIPRSCPF